MTGGEGINPGSIILIIVILYFVYRSLTSINQSHDRSAPAGGEGRVIRFPNRPKRPALPEKIALVKEDATAEQNPFVNDRLATEAKKLLEQKNNMENVGDFSVQEMPGYFLRVYTHHERSLLAILYKDPMDRKWLNLLTEYADGRIITTSSAEKGAINSDRPRGMPLFLYSDMPMDQLYRRHKLETRGTEIADPIASDRFADFFQKNYSRLRASVIERSEGAEHPLKDADIPQLTKAAPAKATQKAPESVVEPVANISAPSSRQLMEWLKAIYRAVPIPDEKKEKFQQGLVWVLENTAMESVADTLADYTDVTITEVEKGRWVIRSERGAEDIIEPGKLSGPELFDKVNASLPEKRRFNKVPVSLKGVAFYSMMELSA